MDVHPFSLVAINMLLCRLRRHGNLPRTNKVSTGHFVTLPPVGPSFRFPYSRNKIKKDIRMDVLFYW